MVLAVVDTTHSVMFPPSHNITLVSVDQEDMGIYQINVTYCHDDNLVARPSKERREKKQKEEGSGLDKKKGTTWRSERTW
ncbi:hypothetical protein TNCV_2348901 [Trichonephila clavipes]|uniref:Uncharacterized protein n=1 Tax=Trichonephila clavipes TaxID=2585209 RepID=A0A8X6SRU2_TRICX|nr:hypothetical protein TNCV_2348901 [Trichonephila clavipes]